MASNTETGHAVNISNFKLLLDNVNAIPITTYAPSNTDITASSLLIAWTTADGAHQTLTNAIQNAKNPINAREILFAPLSKTVTRALNILNSTKASSQIKKDAKGLGDKVRGYKVKVKKLPDGTPDPTDVSNSHLSFVQRSDTFKQLVDLLASESNYLPAEPDLTVAALTTLSTSLKTANDGIGTIIAPVQMARVTRNQALYNEEDGLLVRVAAVKDYVQGALGYSSPVAKNITKIKFTRPKGV